MTTVTSHEPRQLDKPDASVRDGRLSSVTALAVHSGTESALRGIGYPATPAGAELVAEHPSRGLESAVSSSSTRCAGSEVARRQSPA
jgi:hypothetical protein